MNDRWDRGDYAHDPRAVAQRLLGAVLVTELAAGARTAGRIVETEAYLGVKDRAAHSFGGRRTERVRAMYSRGGTAYVYFTYGMHYCFNVVCGAVDEPVAVLVRALAPVEGVAVMRERRGERAKDRELCAGPARLCVALGIGRSMNGADLTDPESPIWIERGEPAPNARIGIGPRIGVGYAGVWARRRLRYWVKGDEHVSR